MMIRPQKLLSALALVSSVCSNLCFCLNLSRFVVFTPEYSGNVLYSERSFTFDGNTDIKVYIVQVLGARLRYVSWENEHVSPDHATVRAISRSKYSLRSGCEPHWHILGKMTQKIIKKQSWFTTWWDSFDNSNHSCGVDIVSAGPYVDATQGNFLEGLSKIKEFFVGLKQTFVTPEEVQAQLNEQTTANNAHSATTDESLQLFQTCSKLHDQSVSSLLLPGDHFFADHNTLFNGSEANEFLEDWQTSPLEIICVSKQQSPQVDFINGIHDLVRLLAAPTFDSPRHVGYTGFHFSSNFAHTCQCPGTLKTALPIPIMIVNLGMMSPETLVTGHLLASHFQSLTNDGMTYDTAWTIRGGSVLLTVMVNDVDSPGVSNGVDRKGCLTAAMITVKNKLYQTSLKEKLVAGGDWESSRTTGAFEVSFSDLSRFQTVTQGSANITSWLSEAFETEQAFDALRTINEAILADETETQDVIFAFSEKVERVIRFALGPNNARSLLFNFVPTGTATPS